MLNRILNVAMAIVGVIFVISLSLTPYLTEQFTLPKEIYIPKGSIKHILSHIEDELNIPMSRIDRYIVSFFGNPQSGWIELPHQQMSRIEFLKAITEAKAPSLKITLYPGETTPYFLKILTSKFGGDYKELYSYYLSISPFREGFLIPETYTINSQRDIRRFLYKVVQYSKKVHRKRMKEFGIERVKELKRYLIIASIIEKESGSKEEMRLVSSVIYNRLDRGMKLQMDGTLNYGLYSHQKITADRIRSDNSYYNTYKIRGLPKEAICNPSREAFEAAIEPADTNYLYFVKVKGKNRHIFSETYSEHLREIERLR